MRVFKTIFYSVICKAKIIIYEHADLELHKGSKISVKDKLFIGKKWHKCDKSYTSFIIGKGASFKTDKLIVYDGCRVNIKKNAYLNFKSGYMNSGVTINVKDKISIGEDCEIASGVVIRDNNSHSINKKRDYKEIVIGNHVWIGTNSVILPGTKLGNGVVVAAGSVVNKEFPDNVLIGGVPAKIIKENIEWGDAIDEKI